MNLKLYGDNKHIKIKLKISIYSFLLRIFVNIHVILETHYFKLRVTFKIFTIHLLSKIYKCISFYKIRYSGLENVFSEFFIMPQTFTCNQSTI